MDEMVERVALAIREKIYEALAATPPPLPGPGRHDDWVANSGMLDLEEVALAAIAAMRSPPNGEV